MANFSLMHDWGPHSRCELISSKVASKTTNVLHFDASRKLRDELATSCQLLEMKLIPKGYFRSDIVWFVLIRNI